MNRILKIPTANFVLIVTNLVLVIVLFVHADIVDAKMQEINAKIESLENVEAEDTVESTIDNVESTASEEQITASLLGTFKVTAYCHCEKCCGKSNGITATGSKVCANRTIAVDPKIIPLGSQIMIDGQIYIAEDVGGAIKGNRIDMYFPTHQEALDFGVQYKQISILQGGELS